MPSGTATSAASTKPPTTRQMVTPMSLAKPVFAEQQPAVLHHRERIGEECLRHEAAERGDRPDGEEQHEEQDAERDTQRVGNGHERLHDVTGKPAHQRVACGRRRDARDIQRIELDEDGAAPGKAPEPGELEGDRDYRPHGGAHLAGGEQGEIGGALDQGRDDEAVAGDGGDQPVLRGLPIGERDAHVHQRGLEREAWRATPNAVSSSRALRNSGPGGRASGASTSTDAAVGAASTSAAGCARRRNSSMSPTVSDRVVQAQEIRPQRSLGQRRVATVDRAWLKQKMSPGRARRGRRRGSARSGRRCRSCTPAR